MSVSLPYPNDSVYSISDILDRWSSNQIDEPETICLIGEAINSRQLKAWINLPLNQAIKDQLGISDSNKSNRKLVLITSCSFAYEPDESDPLGGTIWINAEQCMNPQTKKVADIELSESSSDFSMMFVYQADLLDAEEIIFPAEHKKNTDKESTINFENESNNTVRDSSTGGHIDHYYIHPNTSPQLRHLLEANNRFWKNYDPSDKETAPTKNQVVEWLKDKGYSGSGAKSMDTILRAGRWRVGGRPAIS